MSPIESPAISERAQLALTQRPRRLRRTPALRRMARETRLSVDNLVAPLFVKRGSNVREPISSMPGCHRLSIDRLVQEAQDLYRLGIPAVALFPVIPDDQKDPEASRALDQEGLYPRAIRTLKKKIPDLMIITDTALDPYSSDGHDGVVEDGSIINDATVSIMTDIARLHADAGADIIAPSDMMDGRVGEIRRILDENGFADVSILSYTAKYASAFYGPFRDALDSAPRTDSEVPEDKSTYQMDPANVEEAVREVELDLEEGADMVMVKPAHAYLDVLYRLRQVSTVPVAAYHVSGEYAMLKAAAANGWLNEKAVVQETLTAIKRAGADIILTYFAKDAAQWLREQR